MRPDGNQPVRSYDTAETRTFDNVKNITSACIKFLAIIDQTEFYMYNKMQFISDYLRPLSENEYTITDTKFPPQVLANLGPLQDDEENVSYDAKSLFTSTPILKTIDYIIKQVQSYAKSWRWINHTECCIISK